MPPATPPRRCWAVPIRAPAQASRARWCSVTSPRGMRPGASWPASGAVERSPPSVTLQPRSAPSVTVPSRWAGVALIAADEIPWLQTRLHELSPTFLDVGSSADHVGQDVADLQVNAHTHQLVGALHAVLDCHRRSQR